MPGAKPCSAQWWIQDFPWGGMDLVGRRGLPMWLLFENFVCQNKRIQTLRGACTGHAP